MRVQIWDRIWITLDSSVRATPNTARFRRVTRNLVSLLRRHLRRFDVRREDSTPLRPLDARRSKKRVCASSRRIASASSPSSPFRRRASAPRRLPPSSLARSHPHAPRARDRRRALDSEERRVTRRLADASRAATTVDTRARDRRETRAKRATNARRRANRADGARGRSDPRVESFFSVKPLTRRRHGATRACRG